MGVIMGDSYRLGLQHFPDRSKRPPPPKTQNPLAVSSLPTQNQLRDHMWACRADTQYRKLLHVIACKYHTKEKHL